MELCKCGHKRDVHNADGCMRVMLKPGRSRRIHYCACRYFEAAKS